MVAERILLLAALVVLPALSGTGGASEHAQNPPTKSSPAPDIRTDLYGDPLPPGAVARLGTIRFRRDTAYSMAGVALLPDGKTLLTAHGHEVQFWDSASGRMLRELRTEPVAVQAFALAPDGKRFAIAGWHPWVGGKPGPAELRVFDTPSGKLLQTFSRKDFRDLSNCKLAFSPDGGLLFSISTSGKLRVEEIASGKERLAKELPKDYPYGLAVSADGAYLAVAYGANVQKLFLWKWQDEEPRELARNERFQKIRFSPDGKTLAAVSQLPGWLHLWEVGSGRLLYQRQNPERDYRSSDLIFTPDGTTLAISCHRTSGVGQGKIELLDAANGKSRGFLAGSASWLTVSPDSKRLAGIYGQGMRLWDLTTRQEIAANQEAHYSAATHILVSPRGLLVTAGEDHTLRLWDAASSKQRRVHAFDGWLRGIALSPDGNLLSTSIFDDTVRLFAVDSGREIYRLPGHGRYGGRRTLAFLPDGRSFLSWGDDFFLRRWDVKTGRALFEHAIRPSGVDIPDEDTPAGLRSFHELSLGNATVSPDGKTLVLALGGHLHFFDVASGKEHNKIPNSGSWMNSMAISPNSKYLLVGQYGRYQDKNHDVFLRAISGGELLRLTLPGYSSGPVAFSADGRSFATAVDSPSEIRVFETSSGQERRRIGGFRGRVRSLAFFPDGRRLASGMSDSTVLIWDLTALPSE